MDARALDDAARRDGAPIVRLDEVRPDTAHADAGPADAGNRRFAVRLADDAEVEAVLYRGDTLCVSCQVGCAVRCPFCASGARGLARPLTLDELEGQVRAVEALGVSLAGVTVSGVGEPLHNADAVEAFVRRAHARGLRVTLTTSGGPLPRLEAFLRDVPHRGLTISVHAGTEPVRARLVPHAPALDALFALLARTLPTLTRARRKRTALAYLLLEGQNDAEGELDAFAARARPLGVPIHLYAHNPVPTSVLRGPDRTAYEAAYARLVDAGLVVRMSSRARLEPNGGCGTLVALRRRDRAAPDGDRPIR